MTRRGSVAYQHLVLTRYAQKGLFYDDFSEDWLRDRLRIFRAYCVPGMAQQSEGGFSWLISCDETIDPAYLDSIRASARFVPQLELVLTSHQRDLRFRQVTADQVTDETEVLITTRLDNDDTLHREAIATVQSYLEPFLRSPHRRWVLNFPRGYRYEDETGRLYAANWIHGPFMSLFERLRPGEDFRDIYNLRHNWLHHRFPLHFEESIPGWIQVIHGLAESTEYRSGIATKGGNRESKVKKDVDIEVDPAELGDAFGLELRRPVPATTR